MRGATRPTDAARVRLAEVAAEVFHVDDQAERGARPEAALLEGRERGPTARTTMTYDQIWLIGFSGTGKSRLVRALAAALDWQAVDLDKLVEERAGEPVPQIFRHGGEAAFREIESAMLEETAQRNHIVVATGGGAVLSERNRETMRRHGFIACLDARPETILQRLQTAGMDTSERPLLQAADPIARIIDLKSARQPLYAQADFIIQTDDMTPDQVTHQVLLAFRERTAVAGSTA